MDNKVVVVTDSMANIPKQMVAQYKIMIVPVMLLVQGKLYRDGVDITPSEAYKLFLQDPDSFKTSPASPGHYLEAYREANKHAKSILCITLSSKISTAYDVAARAAMQGKDLAEVVKVAEEVRDKATFLVLLDTIRHVYRTGRIPKVASQIGSMLNIKPILTSSSGLVRFKGMVRNREKGIKRILEILRDEVGQSAVHVAVMHAYAPDDAEMLKERISSEFNCAELFITEFSPVMGYATGTGTLGFAFYKD